MAPYYVSSVGVDLLLSHVGISLQLLHKTEREILRGYAVAFTQQLRQLTVRT